MDDSSARPAVTDRIRFVAFAFASADAFLEIDPDLTIQYAGGTLDWLAGAGEKPAVGQSLALYVGRLDLALLKAALAKTAASGRMDALQVNFGSIGDRRMRVCLSATVLPEFPERIFLAFKSIALLGNSRTLQNLRADDRSGLLDRDGFLAVAEALVQRGERNGEKLSITLLELDGLAAALKKLPDEQADSVLGEIGATLRACSVEGQASGQIDEERFGVLQSQSTPLNVQQILMEKVDALLPGAGIAATGVSIPVETTPDGIETADDLAKALSYAVGQFSDGAAPEDFADLQTSYKAMLKKTQDRIVTFRSMVRRNRFDMVLQPIVHLKTRKAHHFEALARFKDGMEGQSPYQLINFAENVGLIYEFDLAMCKRAIGRIQNAIDSNTTLSIAVNLSGQSIQNDQFMDDLVALLKQNQEISRSLMFEITESSRISDLDGANARIARLRRGGFDVCLDDFGAGAAGFQYLRALTVDYVKIDGIYVAEAMATKSGPIFLKSMASLCRDLGIKTIGEQVETEEQAALLRKIKVDYAQGFLFNQPTI